MGGQTAADAATRGWSIAPEGGDTAITWGELEARANQTAALLAARGVGQDDVVAIALANGFASGLMMRRDTTPDAPFPDNFHGYDPAEARLKDAWQQTVHEPCREALETQYGVLTGRNSLGEIFRYNALAELCQRLEAQAEG